MVNYYQILEVNENASFEDIKTAYRRLSQKYHPDGNKKFNNEELFKIINDAYKNLSDENKRSEYDFKLNEFKNESSYNSYKENQHYNQNYQNESNNQYSNYKQQNNSSNSKVLWKILPFIGLILLVFLERGYFDRMFYKIEKRDQRINQIIH